MLAKKPTRGTAEHRRFVVDRVRAYLESGGPRRFKTFERAQRKSGDVVYVTKRDVQSVGDWPTCMALALGGDGPQRIDFSELHFEDDETDPHYLPPPLEAIPEGWEPRRVKTKVDADGEEQQQWIAARPELERSPVVSAQPEGHYLKGVSTYVDGAGSILGQWQKTDVAKEEREAMLRRLASELPTLLTERAEPIEPPKVDAADMLAIYPWGDPHFGLLTRACETGSTFNIDLAERLTIGAMHDLTQRGPDADEALILNVGDSLHADDSTNRTRRSGHALSVEGDFMAPRRAILRAFNASIRFALQRHKRVKVVSIPGNHDDDSTLWLQCALALWYEHEPRVEVVQSPSIFFWQRFGKVLIGATHGHTTKHEELGAIMANERAEDWGATDHRYMYCGHLHHTIKKEVRGVVVEVFRTLAARTKYEASHGYKSGRDMVRIALHAEDGEVSREVVHAGALLRRFEREAA